MESQLKENIKNEAVPILFEENETILAESGKLQDELEYSCKCGIKFKYFIDLVRHESKKHINEFEFMVKGLKDLLLYVINKFDEENQDTFYFNEEQHGFETQIIDPGEDFFDDISIEREIKTEKSEIEIPAYQVDPKKYFCSYCGKQLSFQKSLKLHIEKKHKDVPLYQCNVCPQNFVLLSEYEAHQKLHEPDSNTKKPKRNNTLTLSQKKRLIDYADQGMSIRWIENKTKVPKSTVHTIIKNREKVLEYLNHEIIPVTSRAVRKLRHPKVEKNLYIWYLSEKKQNIELTHKMIQRKAIELHRSLCDKKNCTFKASLNFTQKFLRRHDLILSNFEAKNSNNRKIEP